MNVFDLDGTIIDITERWYRLHVDLAREHQLPPLEREAYISLKRDGIPEMEIMKNRGRRERVAAYIAKRQEYIEHPRYIAYDSLVPGIDMVLTAWSRRGDLLLATNRKNRGLCLAQLDQFAIASHFVQVVLGGAGGKASAISEQVPLDSLVGGRFVSDALEDRAAAVQLGMQPITVGYGCRSESYFHKHDVETIIRCAADLVPCA